MAWMKREIDRQKDLTSTWIFPLWELQAFATYLSQKENRGRKGMTDLFSNQSNWISAISAHERSVKDICGKAGGLFEYLKHSNLT